MVSRDAVSMTKPELERFLAVNNKVQVATVGPNGMPHLSTLFYAIVSGRIAFWTYAKSQKVKNLERDQRLSCLVETGEAYGELAGVSIQGNAELVTDPGAVLDLGLAVTRAMPGNPAAELGEQMLAELLDHQASKRYGVVVTPLRVASWDHAKLASPPGM